MEGISHLYFQKNIITLQDAIFHSVKRFHKGWLIRPLINAGANVKFNGYRLGLRLPLFDRNTIEHNSLLHIASYKCNQKHIEILGEYGADINSVNAFAMTPLHLILREINCSYTNIVESIIKLNPDLTIRDIYEHTVLDIARLHHYDSNTNNKKIIDIIVNAIRDRKFGSSSDFCNKETLEFLTKMGYQLN